MQTFKKLVNFVKDNSLPIKSFTTGANRLARLAHYTSMMPVTLPFLGFFQGDFYSTFERTPTSLSNPRCNIKFIVHGLNNTTTTINAYTNKLSMQFYDLFMARDADALRLSPKSTSESNEDGCNLLYSCRVSHPYYESIINGGVVNVTFDDIIYPVRAEFFNSLSSLSASKLILEEAFISTANVITKRKNNLASISIPDAEPQATKNQVSSFISTVALNSGINISNGNALTPSSHGYYKLMAILQLKALLILAISSNNDAKIKNNMDLYEDLTCSSVSIEISFNPRTEFMSNKFNPINCQHRKLFDFNQIHTLSSFTADRALTLRFNNILDRISYNSSLSAQHTSNPTYFNRKVYNSIRRISFFSDSVEVVKT